MAELITAEYQSLLRERYTRPGWGASGRSWAEEVARWAKFIDARTAIDFGCGRGTLAQALPALHWQEYDPGIVGKDTIPRPSDLLVSTDVLEHVEPQYLEATLELMRSLTIKGAFFNIALGPAKEVLADGRNAHLIQQTPTFWVGSLAAYGFFAHKVETRKGLCVWALPR